MKKLLSGMILLALTTVVPVRAMAEVDINIGISLPPLIVFDGPPDVIVLPDTDDVYVVPDLDVEIYFWNGWWWRPWGGRWYCSHYYSGDWAYYGYVPSFYFDVDLGWRGYYRSHRWHGHPWIYERVPHRHLQQNWQDWHSRRYWERQRVWGVQSYQPRPSHEREELRHRRQVQYEQRPEVRREEQRHPRGEQLPQRQETRYRQRPEARQEQGRQGPVIQREEQQRHPQVQQPRQEIRHRSQDQYRQKPVAQRVQQPGQAHQRQHRQHE